MYFFNRSILYFCYEMSWLKHIYKENIYGIMGTLAFHILLISSFMIADIDKKGKMKEEPVIIEFPEILPEMEEMLDNRKPEAGGPDDENVQLATNRASNVVDSREDEFFDEEYRREIEEAQKLVDDVNNQLRKEVANLEDIKMPVERTEGMAPDSIKNVIYSGESNIVYDLANRYHVSLPIPVYLAQGGGTVTVDIVVGPDGGVLKASARENPTVTDKQVFYYAEIAASRTLFNADPSAPPQQKGTIMYRFIAQ